MFIYQTKTLVTFVLMCIILMGFNLTAWFSLDISIFTFYSYKKNQNPIISYYLG
jgi:hypothetical protein